MKNEKQTKLSDFIQPENNEVFRTQGKCCYAQTTKAYTKIILKKEFADECKKLKKKEGNFFYDLEFPRTNEAKKKYIKQLMNLANNGDAWPFILWIREDSKEKIEKCN